VARVRVDGVLDQLGDCLARIGLRAASQRMRSKGSAGRSTKVRADVFGTDGSVALHRRRRLASRKRLEREEMRRSRQPSLPVGMAVSVDGGAKLEADEEAQMCARASSSPPASTPSKNLRDAPYRPG